MVLKARDLEVYSIQVRIQNFALVEAHILVNLTRMFIIPQLHFLPVK